MDDPDHSPEGAGAAEPTQLSAVPFVVALVFFVVVAVWAWSALRSDAELEVVRIDGFDVVDGTTFRAAGQTDADTCATLERTQVDLAEDQIFAEFVIRPLDDCDGPTDLVATVTLPQPIDGRRLVSGAGRLRLPCSPDGSEWVCADR